MAKKSSYEREDYEAHDAMHTLMRADEIRKDKKLMARVEKKAQEHSEKMREVSERAGQLAKSGRISEKQMSKLKSKGQGGKVKDLDKTGKIASGKEGDSGGPSRTSQGINYH